MPKGATCPNCGEQKWRTGERGGRHCTGCGARGWLGGDPPSGGGGKGRACGYCSAHKLVLVDDSEPEVRFCTGCAAVIVLSN